MKLTYLAVILVIGAVVLIPAKASAEAVPGVYASGSLEVTYGKIDWERFRQLTPGFPIMPGQVATLSVFVKTSNPQVRAFRVTAVLQDTGGDPRTVTVEQIKFPEWMGVPISIPLASMATVVRSVTVNEILSTVEVGNE